MNEFATEINWKKENLQCKAQQAYPPPLLETCSLYSIIFDSLTLDLSMGKVK